MYAGKHVSMYVCMYAGELQLNHTNHHVCCYFFRLVTIIVDSRDLVRDHRDPHRGIIVSFMLVSSPYR